MQGSAILSWSENINKYYGIIEYQLGNEMKQFTTSSVILNSFDTKTHFLAENLKRSNKILYFYIMYEHFTKHIYLQVYKILFEFEDTNFFK